jgi:hypothetical protein
MKTIWLAEMMIFSAKSVKSAIFPSKDEKQPLALKNSGGITRSSNDLKIFNMNKAP